MEDNDDLYFSFDDDEDVPADPDAIIEGEESQNRTFLIGAIILAAIFVIGIAVVAILVFFPRDGGEPQVSANELTNQANMTLYAATQTAAFETQQAPPVVEETEEPVETEEMTEEPVETEEPIETEEATEPPEETEEPEATEEATSDEVAEVTDEPTEEATEDGQGGGGDIETPTPTDEVSGIIEVTPLGDGGDEEPTEEAGATEDGQGGGQIEPSAEATLPDTGFSAGAGLAGAGVLAIALVSVLVVVRRIRFKD